MNLLPFFHHSELNSFEITSFVSILYSKQPEKTCLKVTKNRFFVPVDKKSVENGTAGCII